MPRVPGKNFAGKSGLGPRGDAILQAVELLNGHTPSSPLRGGKYSNFDAGTRIP